MTSTHDRMERSEAEPIYLELSHEADRRRRRADIRRVVGTVASVGLIAAGLIWVFVSLSPLGSDGEPADQPSFDPYAYGTYVLQDVGIGPSEDRRPDGTLDRHKVEVLFAYRWSGDVYPGEHECRFSVLDGDGDEIGFIEGDISSLDPQVSDRHGVPVPITGTIDDAAEAVIACDPARQDTPVAYEISDERVTGTFKWREDSDPGVIVEYRVGSPVESPEYPGENWCTVELFRSGDRVAISVFTLAVGPGQMEQRVWPDDFSVPSAIAEAASLRADVTCEPYTGHNVSSEGVGVTDPPIAAIPVIWEEISSVEKQLASVDVSTVEGRASSDLLRAQLAALRGRLDDLCEKVDQPDLCRS